jgi:hypothetical protein
LKIRNQKDFASGLLFIVIGLAFAYIATSYQMGTPAKMGAGYFPYYLGLLMAGLGLFVSITAMGKKAEENKLAKWDWKSVIWVTGSVILFAVTLPYMGLIVSLIVLIFVAAMASHEFHWKGTVVSAVILNVIAYVAFVWGLKLQFPVWPFFLTN